MFLRQGECKVVANANRLFVVFSVVAVVAARVFEIERLTKKLSIGLTGKHWKKKDLIKKDTNCLRVLG